MHQLVDGNGRTLVALVGPGQAADAPMFPHLMRHLQVARLGRGRARTRPALRLRLHRLGIPNLNGRTRAIRDLLIQAPPAVVASLLGYHPARAELLAAEAGTTWKRCAAGDHARRG